MITARVADDGPKQSGCAMFRRTFPMVGQGPKTMPCSPRRAVSTGQRPGRNGAAIQVERRGGARCGPPLETLLCHGRWSGSPLVAKPGRRRMQSRVLEGVRMAPWDNGLDQD